jgi:membrane protein
MMAAFKARVASVIERVKALKPVRVAVLYGQKRGALLASGLSYHSIFAIFAALWVGFAVVGLVLQSQPALREAFFNIIGTSVPGLFDSAGSKGAIDPSALLKPRTLSWTGAVALVGLLFTALGWLSSCRDAVRIIFELPATRTNFVLLKLKDLGIAAALGIALIVSAVLSVVSTQALGLVFDLVGIDHESLVATIVGRTVVLLLMLILDSAALGALFRLTSGLAIPFKQLLVGSLLGGVALGVLKILGSSLLGGASKNPLLASFAVIIGLLIWFNLICQVILFSGAWIAVSVADRGIELDPVVAARIEKEKKEAALAEAEAAAAQARPWLVRLFRPHSRRRDVSGRS